MTRREYPEMNETLYEKVLPNGLTVLVVPKPGFTKKCAYFATDYGSIHTAYSLEGKGYTTPAGVAHYLEHKMFDLPGERDIMAEFAALGASPNAFTTYFCTAYYFTCTQHFGKCLELLLELCSVPYFTEESVEKERGIIAQEISMYADSADSQVYEDLFSAMYETHPVRVPIAGTVESIEEITAQTLYDCFRAFYHPGNMVLCVVGDVGPEEVCAMAERLLPKDSRPQPQVCLGGEESLACMGRDTRREMDVAMPTFQMGFKCRPPEPGEPAVFQQILGDLAGEALMGESSALYLRLYREGLIDGSFGVGYEDMPGVAMLSCGGDSKDPAAVRKAILQEARRMCREGIPEDLVLRLKKSALGRRYRALDSFDSLCFRLCCAHFDGCGYMDFPGLYARVTPEDIRRFIGENIKEERCVMSVVNPRKQEAIL